MSLKQVAVKFPRELEERLIEVHETHDPVTFLHMVWSQQPVGYFCVSIRPLDGGFHDIWFQFDEDGELKAVNIPDFTNVGGRFKLCSPEWDTYFCVVAFSRPRRVKENVLPARWLFVDLDFIPPDEVPFPPTYAWQTSPGKWQAIWWMQRLMEPEEFARANKTLCHQCDGDPGTWNANRLLRVPGSHHLKEQRNGR